MPTKNTKKRYQFWFNKSIRKEIEEKILPALEEETGVDTSLPDYIHSAIHEKVERDKKHLHLT